MGRHEGLSRAVRALLVLVAFTTLLLLAGLHVFLMTSAGEQAFFSVLNSLIPGSISCRESTLSMVKGEAELLDAVLRGPDGSEIIHAERLKVGISLPRLLERHIALRVTGVEKPVVVLAQMPDRRLNIVAAFVEEDDPDKEDLGIEVSIDDLEVKGGSLSYVAADGSRVLDMDGVDLRGSMDFQEPRVKADASASRIWIGAGKGRVELNRAESGLLLAGDSIRSFSLQLHKGAHRLSLCGSLLDMTGRQVMDVTFESSGDLGELAALLDAGREFNGNLETRVRAVGPMDNPDCTLDARYSGGRLGGVRVERLEASMGLSGRVLSVKKAEADLASGTAGASGTIDLRDALDSWPSRGGPDMGAVAYDLDLKGQGLDLPGIIPGLKGFPRSMTGEITVRGRGLVRPGMEAEASYNLAAGSFEQGFPGPGRTVNLSGTADLDYPVVEIDANASMESAAAGLKGWIDIASTRLGARVSVKTSGGGGSLHGSLEGLEGSFKGLAQISGTLASPEVKAELAGRDVSWKGSRLGTVDVSARLDSEGWLALDRLSARDGPAGVDAKGRIRLFREGFRLDPDLPMELDAAFHLSDPGGILGLRGLTGGLEGELHAAGSLFDPVAAVDLTGQGWSFRGLTLGSLVMRAAFDDGTLKVERLELVNKGSSLKVSGEVNVLDTRRRRFNPDPGIRILADGDGLDLEGFTPHATGRATLHADIRGSLKDPAGGIVVRGDGLVVRGQDISSVTISSSLADRSLFIDSLVVDVSRGQKITGSGRISLDSGKDYELSLTSAGIDLRDLRALEQTPVTGGSLVFDISGRGRRDDPGLTGSVLIRDPDVNHERLPDVFMNVRLEGTTLHVLGERSFGFTADCNLDTGEIDLQALFSRTELRPYFSILGRDDLHGVITGDARVRGNALDWEDMDIAASVSDMNIFLYQESLVSGRDIHVSYRDRTLVVPRTDLKLLDQGSMVLQTRNAGKGLVDLRAEGRLPLQILGAIDPELSGVTGDLIFRAAASGPLMKPGVTGELNFDGLSSPVKYNGQLLTA